MDLREYLLNEGISVTEFAQRCGVEHPTISRIINRRRKPGGDLMTTIYEQTGGTVTPADFGYEVTDAKAERFRLPKEEQEAA